MERQRRKSSGPPKTDDGWGRSAAARRRAAAAETVRSIVKWFCLRCLIHVEFLLENGHCPICKLNYLCKDDEDALFASFEATERRIFLPSAAAKRNNNWSQTQTSSAAAPPPPLKTTAHRNFTPPTPPPPTPNHPPQERQNLNQSHHQGQGHQHPQQRQRQPQSPYPNSTVTAGSSRYFGTGGEPIWSAGVSATASTSTRSHPLPAPSPHMIHLQGQQQQFGVLGVGGMVGGGMNMPPFPPPIYIPPQFHHLPPPGSNQAFSRGNNLRPVQPQQPAYPPNANPTITGHYLAIPSAPTTPDFCNFPFLPPEIGPLDELHYSNFEVGVARVTGTVRGVGGIEVGRDSQISSCEEATN